MACNFMGDEWFVDSLNQKVRCKDPSSGEGWGSCAWQLASGQADRANPGEFRAPEVLLAAVNRDDGAVAGC